MHTHWDGMTRGRWPALSPSPPCWLAAHPDYGGLPKKSWSFSFGAAPSATTSAGHLNDCNLTLGRLAAGSEARACKFERGLRQWRGGPASANSLWRSTKPRLLLLRARKDSRTEKIGTQNLRTMQYSKHFSNAQQIRSLTQE
jgi:hypothetical protein